MLHKKNSTILFAAFLVANCISVQAECADKKQEKSEEKFLRLQRDDQGDPVALQTAIVRFSNLHTLKKNPVNVDLIGAMHVAEESYYSQLNERFKNYDVVLYELIAPEGTRIPKGGKSEGTGNPISAIQGGLKSILELEFQLEAIDYTKKNFVHADISPKEFSQSMKDRGESIFQLIIKMMGQANAQQMKSKGSASELQLLFALFSKNRSLTLKRIMAEQFEDLESKLGAMFGPDGSTIVTVRNQKALEVLRREMESGKKKIAIFYGAGHLKDMQERLISDHGFKPIKKDWLTAWNLKSDTKKKSP